MNLQQDFKSLDYLAAAASQRIASGIGTKVKNDNTVEAAGLGNFATKALGVLQEQGVYALLIFLLSRSGKETAVDKMTKEEFIACQHTGELLNLLKKKELAAPGVAYKEQLTVEGINSSKEAILKHFLQAGGILENLDKLLLIRDLYEQTLIYTRYAAKAREEGK
ncbi:MAG: hypothetical protein C4589_04005 [Peptococcaceae bacterium]|nr:MAG: hypothetical protein C4589_04005 [Peptococcaceae bacterium]